MGTAASDAPTPLLPESAGETLIGASHSETHPTLCLGGPTTSDRYEVLAELGRGGMGVVYRARDRTLGRDVALKVLRFAGTADADMIGRFQREARAAAALDHPNIVRIHDVGTLPDGAPFYTMELLQGEDLADAVEREALHPRQAVEALRQVALALLHAHQKGIFHRDVKPQNVFLRRGPSEASSEVHAMLLDFGLAKLTDRDDAGGGERLSLTQSGQLIGTPAYMAPEQARGERDIDPRTDIYGLGATLYFALCHRPPFDAPSLAEVLSAVQGQEPVPVRRIAPDVPRDIETICLKCLEKRPMDRYLTAGDLAEDCRRYLAGEPILARPVSRVRALWNRVRRNRTAVAFAAAFAVLLAVLGLYVAGSRIVRRVRLENAMSEAELLLRDHKYGQAKDRAKKAVALAPGEERYATLLHRALAGECVELGRAAFARYREQRTRAETLAADLATADGGLRSTPPSEPERLRAERWQAEDRLRVERRESETSWADSVMRFTEALGHWADEEGARVGLAELYWDRYLDAERARDLPSQEAYLRLVEAYGGDEYRARVRGERDVCVVFRLPRGTGGTVDAWLYEYRRMGEPPILVPVPYDVSRGEAIGAGTALGAPRWEPVSLLASDSERQRGRSVPLHELTLSDANRLRLEVDAAACAALRVRLPRGSYLLYVPGREGDPGLSEVRYPLEVCRDEDWIEECEVPSADDRPPVPPGWDGEALGACWAYVPPGPCQASGDPEAEQMPSRSAVRHRVPADGAAGFQVLRFEVSFAMYLEYLNDRGWHGAREALAHVPREALDVTLNTVFCAIDKQGVFSLGNEILKKDFPVLGVSRDDGEDYCRWLEQKVGAGTWAFSLPTEDEWEKAARGADGRFHPWGDEFHPSFCRMLDSRVTEASVPTPEPLGAFPVDESPYGVRDMAGGAREWTSTTIDAAHPRAVLKGGAWSVAAIHCRSASRANPEPMRRSPTSGFRIIARRK